MSLSDERIREITEVVSNHEISIEGVDQRLKIKVVKLGENSFQGVANLEVKGTPGMDFYRSLTLRNTKEEALEDAVRGFFAFYSEEAEVREVKDW